MATTDAADSKLGDDGDDFNEFIVVAPGVSVSAGGAVTPTPGSKLGMLFTAVLEALLAADARPGAKARWVHRSTPGLRWDLLLSEAQGQSIPWKKIGAVAGDWQSRGAAAPLVNFSRGFKALCRKSMLVTTLRAHAAVRPAARVAEWLPASFNFYPAKPELSEEAPFRAAFAARAAGAGGGRNAWILKPSDGGKGERIKVMAGDGPSGAEAVLGFLAAQPAGSIAWVVSEYIERPLLLPGRRKFDWRLWVLLGAGYEVRLWREGVLRTCSVAFDLSDLDDAFAHLSNHCIQTEAATYGAFEPTNEMFYAEFSALCGGAFECSLLPQVVRASRTIVDVLCPARPYFRN
jgi:hypothetical protein